MRAGRFGQFRLRSSGSAHHHLFGSVIDFDPNSGIDLEPIAAAM
jgi:hypothetical protein